MKGERKMPEKNEVKKETKVEGKVTIGDKAKKKLNPEKKDGKNKTKFIIIGVVVVAIIIIIVAVASFGGRIANQVKLDQEMIALFDGTLSEDNMNIKTTGKFAVVEEAIKDYYKKTMDAQDKLMEIIQDEKIQNMLSVENYQEDGPEFATSKEYINNAKTSLNEVADELAGYFNMETIMAQIEDKNLSDYYVELYKKYFFNGEEDLSNEFKVVYDEMEATKNLMNNLYDNELKILDFLTENKSHWKVDGGKVVFDSSSILAQYNSLKVQLSIQ